MIYIDCIDFKDKIQFSKGYFDQTNIARVLKV